MTYVVTTILNNNRRGTPKTQFEIMRASTHYYENF